MKLFANSLLNKFMKDLIIQILAMVSEQENESRRGQAQGIKVTKESAVLHRPITHVNYLLYDI